MRIPKKIKKLCLEEAERYALTRSAERIKQLGEVFTPTELVLEMIEQLPALVFRDGKTYLDPACGNGQFLAAIAIIKRERGHKEVLATIFGVDISLKNVNEARARLLAICGNTQRNRTIVNFNIRRADALKFNFDIAFDNPPYRLRS